MDPRRVYPFLLVYCQHLEYHRLEYFSLSQIAGKYIFVVVSVLV